MLLGCKRKQRGPRVTHSAARRRSKGERNPVKFRPRNREKGSFRKRQTGTGEPAAEVMGGKGKLKPEKENQPRRESFEHPHANNAGRGGAAHGRGRWGAG